MKVRYIISAVFVGLSCTALAQAQSDRTFISAHGIDNTTCGTLNAPCRSFNVGLGKTNPGGEVIALDSGIYDTFNIVISVPVTLAGAPGAHVEIANTSLNDGARITIHTPINATVTLRDLYISQQGDSQLHGIHVTSVGTLHIENCVVSGFGSGTGIFFDLAAGAQATIQDTVVRDCGNGIFVASTADVVKVSIDHCRLQNCVGVGLDAFSHARVTVRDSVASGTLGGAGIGFEVEGGDLNIERCEASNNDIGIQSSIFGSEAATVTVSNSIVTNNKSFGFLAYGGSDFQSLGNNIVRRNGTNTSGTITSISGT
jgi:hypothetical protein